MATEKKGASKQKVLSKRTGRKLRYVNDATFKHRPPLLLLLQKVKANSIDNIKFVIIYLTYLIH